MSDLTFQAQAVDWKGLPAIALKLGQGDSALICLQGAQVLSWVGQGQERLFLSPRASHDGKSSIRGGIPVCFPQFNQRGPLVKHGFARLSHWQADAARPLGEDGVQISLRLTDSEASRAVWLHAFEAVLTIELRPGALRVELAVHNRSRQDLSFTAALHGYLRVAQVEQTSLHGLEGLSYWDAAAAQPDTHVTQEGCVSFGAETDRVYPRAAAALQLQSSGRPWLQLAQDASWSETVVWNPGPALCATLKDMEADSWQQMLCVEAAAIDAPVVLGPDQRWKAAQTFECF
ncbi:aldose 1-epimerase [Comamonas thiooxydans]|uniref:Putative glucose-6-phosphate 1-epimerase n=1 Tax=Comamonas thiooxydans TaxID=363952 RepID=A0A0E3BB13_9BURK|nr:D-hexose-6-phosphate mutarotase [Comamonas thiooxydans]KGG87979.1 aldose 1-epimerase [Comamonas thiooxydans]